MAENNNKKPYKKRYIWRTRAEELLMELWAEKILDLRGSRNAGNTYIEMASNLARSGVKVTAEEIKTKLHNWSKKYRMEKRIVDQSGGSPSTWKYFNKADAILGRFKISKVDALIEDTLLDDPLNDHSTFMPCESLPSLVSPPNSRPVCSSGISTPVIKKKSKDQNNIRTIINAMETALEKQHAALEKMVDDMREFDERNFRLLARLVDSTIETNNAVRNYFNSKS